ncbi:MAG: phosphoribosylformylglycinamidine synthase [Firmicutes bacterium]|nr:phosphoribosylformylglycinamidine synthase [Bacillota bacterium]
MSVTRLFVEKKPQYRLAEQRKTEELTDALGVCLEDFRMLLRYDVQGLSDAEYALAAPLVFYDEAVDACTQSDTFPVSEGYYAFAAELQPGQYDRRADEAEQAVRALIPSANPVVRCATLYLIKVKAGDELKVKRYIINPVESREAAFEKPETLTPEAAPAAPVKMIKGFVDFSPELLNEFRRQSGYAMTDADMAFVQSYFKEEMRDPTETELKALDTYWSDHCRHTTFLTRLKNVDIRSDIPAIKEAFETYLGLFNKHYKGRPDKYPSLMDIATIGARELKECGKLANLDISEEVNACSIRVPAEVNGKTEDWIVMFKNETHNHPTEIEPFGGAATALGGGIRDPLSGRVYVYHSMRVTGAADINAPIKSTLKGKLPQRVISSVAAAGFSSYANQAGLAGGLVTEFYHPGYVAKRMEAGFLTGAAPAKNIIKEKPAAGDVVLLIGGNTGRDGCGGATGSSRTQSADALDVLGAEVQKGTAYIGRKMQRLFRNPELTKRIKRCNDFGAGGVSVAVGELADGLDIQLDAVPLKYAGLSATEIAISESQERMAVVVAAKDAEKVIKLCAAENLDASLIAQVTDTGRLRMYHAGNLILDLRRKFLNTNGAAQSASAQIHEKPVKYFDTLYKEVAAGYKKGGGAGALRAALGLENAASQKGLVQMFDSTVGAGSVLVPLGGKYSLTPAVNMAAKLPVQSGDTDTCTVCAHGFNPYLSEESPFTGALYAVLCSVIKVVAAGVPLASVRLTFQEFFERLGTEPQRWGKPVSALLGALTAQLGLETAAIGGKDSMSGSFGKIDVPPTLISFALGVGKASGVITNVLSRAGQKVYRYKLPKNAAKIPDIESIKEFLHLFQGEILRGIIDFASITESDGAAAAIAKSCLGNGFGFNFAAKKEDYFTPAWGDILFATDRADDFVGYTLEYMGEVTQAQQFTFGGDDTLSIQDAGRAFTDPFKAVFPFIAPDTGEKAENIDFAAKKILTAKKKIAKPTVLIPIAEGTHGEYDLAKSFENAGAAVEQFVIRTRSAKDLEESVKELTARIKACNILAFAGGASYPDAPGNAGKLMANVFKNAALTDALRGLTEKRDGLILGVGSGFSALVRMGLLKGTFTFNPLARHTASICRVRLSSNLSPWMRNCTADGVYSTVYSHAEGRLIVSDDELQVLIKNGQIAAQYADFNGNASMLSPFNPGGATAAIESLTSADGRILGKMGHCERMGGNLMKNADIQALTRIFEAGVGYFK